MKKDTHKTKVQFLKNKDELFAYFPNEIHSSNLRTCYAHIGQHSPCSIEYANEAKKATKREYKELQKELENIGYNLEII